MPTCMLIGITMQSKGNNRPNLQSCYQTQCPPACQSVSQCSQRETIVPTYGHVVEGDAHVVRHSFAEDRDLCVALTEVVQQDELGSHALADVHRLRRGAEANR